MDLTGLEALSLQTEQSQCNECRTLGLKPENTVGAFWLNFFALFSWHLLEFSADHFFWHFSGLRFLVLSGLRFLVLSGWHFLCVLVVTFYLFLCASFQCFLFGTFWRFLVCDF